MMFGKTGAPVCAGDRLTLTWLDATQRRWYCRSRAARWPARAAGRDRRRARSCRAPRSAAIRTGDQAKPSARRNVVGIGGDGLEELQIVADAEVQGQARADLPFVLRIEADIRICLRNHGIAERLRESRVVVGSAQKVGQRRKRVTAADRSRIRDGVARYRETPGPREWRAPRLVGEIVHDLVQVVHARRG